MNDHSSHTSDVYENQPDPPPTYRRIVALILTAVLVILGTAAWLVMADDAPTEAGVAEAGAATAGAASGVEEDAESPLEAVPSVYAPERVTFAVQVRDDVIPYRVFGIYALPGESVPIEATFTQGVQADLTAEAGTIEQAGPERWMWTAPNEPGLYRLTVTDARADETIALNAFVKVPYNPAQEALNGYRIGEYAARPLRGNPAYNRPEGFVEVTPETRDALIAPHFTVGQFLCKQTSDFPQYLVLKERLLLKLEMILEEVNDTAIDVPTLHVMSGYRTPYYNRSIGNRTTYSSHLYGGAADIFVDANDDGRMDDLNGDGTVTEADARVLATIVEAQTDETWYQPFIGGLGIYGPAPHRGPFIHVDVRGTIARW